MNPYYEKDGIVIYHADCRDVFSSLQKVDLVLTDPPYGLNKRMQGGTWGSATKYSELRRWDVKPDASIFNLILALSDSAVIWGGNYFELPISRGWLVWDKANAVPTMSDVELAWTSSDRPAKRFRHAVGCHRYGHPSEKPLALMMWCLRLFPCLTVLDPFCGSGTTLEAAKLCGRSAIGIEIEERYCEMAAKRLAQEVFSFGEMK